MEIPYIIDRIMMETNFRTSKNVSNEITAKEAYLAKRKGTRIPLSLEDQEDFDLVKSFENVNVGIAVLLSGISPERARILGAY